MMGRVKVEGIRRRHRGEYEEGGEPGPVGLFTLSSRSFHGVHNLFPLLPYTPNFGTYVEIRAGLFSFYSSTSRTTANTSCGPSNHRFTRHKHVATHRTQRRPSTSLAWTSTDRGRRSVSVDPEYRVYVAVKGHPQLAWRPYCYRFLRCFSFTSPKLHCSKHYQYRGRTREESTWMEGACMSQRNTGVRRGRRTKKQNKM